MATDTPTLSESFGPTINPPRSDAPGGYYVIGTDDRPQDKRTIAKSVSCRVNVKVADREFSTAIPLHEALVLRNYYEQLTGGCQLQFQGYWPPGIDRYRNLTHDLLKSEVARLSAKLVPRKDAAPIDCFGTYFPGNASERTVRLHKVMKEMFIAWEALLAKARARLPETEKCADEKINDSRACNYITEQEIEAVIKLADPSANNLEEIEFQEIPDKPVAASALPQNDLDSIIAQAQLMAEAEPIPASAAAFDRLSEAGFEASIAEKAATLLEHHGSFDKIPEDEIIKAIGGKGKLSAAKIALKG